MGYVVGEVLASAQILADKIEQILNCKVSFMLYGSVALNDFRLGWSDIDFICVTKNQISTSNAEQLLNLRQELSNNYPFNDFFRLFEGVIAYKSSLFDGFDCDVVYWGTSGQRLIKSYQLDVFSRLCLLDSGKLILGEDFRHRFCTPSKREIVEGVIDHCKTIEDFGGTTGASIYTAGWILDIARCVYTLKTGKIISKTRAGEWALNTNLPMDKKVIKNVLKLRNSPKTQLNNPKMIRFLLKISKNMQKYVSILKNELCHYL